jgi:PAS domain-containing protein
MRVDLERFRVSPSRFRQFFSRMPEGLLMPAEDSASKRNNSEAAWLRAVVETAADGVILIDAEGRVLMFNPACEKLFQYQADEVIGQEPGWNRQEFHFDSARRRRAIT